MSVHIELGRSNGAAIVEAIGTSEDIAAEMTAAIGLIYAQISRTKESAGAEFREALTAMTREDAEIWAAVQREIKRGYGTCVVWLPLEREDEHGNTA